MSAPKLRNLGQYGILTDPDPYDLPPTAFSSGVNVRFRNGRVYSAPVFRNVFALGTANPRFLASGTPTSGLDLLMIGYENGRVFRFLSGAETDYSVTSYSPSSVEGVWTTCHLADVFYVNREDRVPWALRTSDTNFKVLAGGWDSGWTCKLLRACSGALVALNVTKSGTATQTMVKTSSFALAGAVPGSWDQTDPSTNATENILAEMEGPIVDAANLGDYLMIYSQNQTWRMSLSGDVEVFNYEKLPFQNGVINANCSIEINSRNYVFGVDDIWMHDGVSQQSICEGQVRSYIFSSLDISKASRCFVSHNQQYRELHFCYVSGDSLASFANAPDGCNRQAVFNYVTNTWTFDDLPLVYSAARANLDSTLTWATAASTWDTVGGTWQDQEDTAKRVLTYVGDTSTPYSLTTSLYAFDPWGLGSVVAFPVDTNATRPLFLARDGIDLDELGEDLQGYKQINYIIPQGRIDPSSTATIDFQFGASDYFSDPAIFYPSMSYDGNTLYKCDFNAAGRYLSLKISFSDYKTMSLSGFDLDLQVTGDR